MEISDLSSDFERVSCYKCPKCEFVSLEKTAIADHLNEQHEEESQQNVIIWNFNYIC